MKKKYQIIIASPVDYEFVTAEILINDKFLAVLQMEEGKDKMLVEFYEGCHENSVYLEDLLSALNAAKELLLK